MVAGGGPGCFPVPKAGARRYKVRVKRTADTARSGPTISRGLRRFLYATAAINGAAILVIEILGAKMLAPYLGTSHFVWTAQIGVTLVALACGYAAGGWLVDRSPRLPQLYAAVLVAAIWLCGAVLLCESVAFGALQWRLALGALIASAVLFFVPLALLAMTGPFLVRVLTESLAEVGQSMGRLTAISTLGSVAGTLLIGYLLIPFLPNSQTMLGTAGVLVALAIGYFVGWHRSQSVGVTVTGGLALGLGFLGALRPPFAEAAGLQEMYRRNSNFGLMQVLETPDGETRYYLNDLLMQNSYHPRTQQSASLFTYMLHDLARVYTPELRSALCIGMGIGIVPMRLARAGVAVEVVEINPDVVPLAQRFFDFDPALVRLHIGDGRQFLNEATHRYDAVILDAFLGESPPAHLMSREAFAAVRARLNPGGTLVMNAFGDFATGKDFLMASLAQTLRQVFANVRIHAAGNGNVFFVASDQPDLAPRSEPDLEAIPGELRWRAESTFKSLQQTVPEHGRVLTDDFNPADFRDAANREDLRRRLAVGYRTR